MGIIERRVLRVHSGEAAQMLDIAKINSCPEIQEREDIEPTKYAVYIEQIVQAVPTDYAALWQGAATIEGKADVLAMLLNLGPADLASAKSAKDTDSEQAWTDFKTVVNNLSDLNTLKAPLLSFISVMQARMGWS